MVDGLTVERHGKVAVKSLLPAASVSQLAVDDFKREVASCAWRLAARACACACACLSHSPTVCVLTLFPTPLSPPVLGRLSHSCLTTCVGTGTRPGGADGSPPVLFLAMEAVVGGDLRHTVLDAMVDPKRYTDHDVARWLHDVARGLNYLHTRTPLCVRVRV